MKNIIRKSISKSVRKIFVNIIFLYLQLHTCTTLSSEHQRATGYELLLVMQYFEWYSSSSSSSSGSGGGSGNGSSGSGRLQT